MTNLQVCKRQRKRSGETKKAGAVRHGESGLQVAFQGNYRRVSDHQLGGICDVEGEVWRWL